MQENTYQAGLAALEKGDLDEAINCFMAAYQAKKTFKVNYLLFETLEKAERYDNAAQIADDYVTDYLKDEAKFLEYVKVMVLAGQIRKIEMTLELVQAFFSEPQTKRLQVQFEKTLAEVRSKEEIETLKKQFKYLGANDVIGQREVFEKTKSLTIKEFEEISQGPLLDPDVHVLLRSAILDELRYLGSEREVEYLSFTKEVRSFIPAALKELNDYLMYQRLTQLLATDSAITPDLKEAALAEMTLKLQLLYPQLTRPFPEPEKLYRVLMDRPDEDEKEKEFAAELEKSLQAWEI